MDITTVLAHQILTESNFTAGDVESSLQVASGPIWDRVYSEVVDLEPAVLGVVAATGEVYGSEDSVGVSLYQVCGSFLRKYDSGLDLLRVLATMVLVARMAMLAKEPITSSE